jgi:hypothetical protein
MVASDVRRRAALRDNEGSRLQERDARRFDRRRSSGKAGAIAWPRILGQGRDGDVIYINLEQK